MCDLGGNVMTLKRDEVAMGDRNGGWYKDDKGLTRNDALGLAYYDQYHRDGTKGLFARLFDDGSRGAVVSSFWLLRTYRALSDHEKVEDPNVLHEVHVRALCCDGNLSPDIPVEMREAVRCALSAFHGNPAFYRLREDQSCELALLKIEFVSQLPSTSR